MPVGAQLIRPSPKLPGLLTYPSAFFVPLLVSLGSRHDGFRVFQKHKFYQNEEHF